MIVTLFFLPFPFSIIPIRLSSRMRSYIVSGSKAQTSAGTNVRARSVASETASGSRFARGSVGERPVVEAGAEATASVPPAAASSGPRAWGSGFGGASRATLSAPTSRRASTAVGSAATAGESAAGSVSRCSCRLTLRGSPLVCRESAVPRRLTLSDVAARPQMTREETNAGYQ